MSKPEWKVGQIVWFQSRVRYLISEEMQIIKIGRKWVTALATRHAQYPKLAERFDIVTGERDVNGYSSSGCLYPSRQHYIDQVEQHRAWQEFRNRVWERNTKEGTSIGRIHLARLLLGLNENERELHDPAMAAIATLEGLGYTFLGGVQWKPPLGQPPNFDAIDRLEKRIAELERHGADAYDHATDMLEEWQRKRASEGKDPLCQGSLCDGLASLFQRIDDLEKKHERQQNS